MSIDRESLKERLNEIFLDIFNDDTIKICDEMTADKIAGWDSLKHITLVVAIEDEFGFKFSASEIGELENIGEILDLIEKRASK